MNGISKTRMVLYALLLVILAGANVYRMGTAPQTETVEPVARKAAMIRVPELEVAGASDAPMPGARDIFRPNTAPEPEQVAAPPPEPTPSVQPPDPRDGAIRRATAQLGTVKLVGVLASGEGALAVFEFEGNTLSRFVGDNIVAGFKLERISNNEIWARNDELGLVAILSLGGTRPMQMTRVE